MDTYEIAKRRVRELRELQIKLDWLIGATPTGKARDWLTQANIALNGAACEQEFDENMLRAGRPE